MAKYDGNYKYIGAFMVDITTAYKKEALEFQKNAERTALSTITSPLLNFFTAVQVLYTVFIFSAGIMPRYYCAVYAATAAVSLYVNFKRDLPDQLISTFIHFVVVFHGIYGTFLYGWGFGAENFLIWGIATGYLIFARSNVVLFFVALEAAVYILLYIFRDSLGLVELSATYKQIIFTVVFGCLFVSFLKRTSSLNIIYSKRILDVFKQNIGLENASKYDFLTGLDNRRYALEQFGELKVYSNDKKVLVSIGDIDDFKKINDTFGHDVGDEIIGAVGHILRENSRDGKDIACRWGGEEFLYIASFEDEDAARAAMDRILKKVNLITTPDNKNVGITVGAILFSEWKHLDLAGMVSMADELLYEGKKDGKNRIKFKIQE